MRSGDGKQTAFFAANDNRICEPVFVVEHDDITEEGAKVVDANMKLLKHAPELLEALKDVLPLVRHTDDAGWEKMKRARLAVENATAHSYPKIQTLPSGSGWQTRRTTQ
jgi:hypothetical protein